MEKVNLRLKTCIVFDGSIATNVKIEKLLRQFKKEVVTYKGKVLVDNAPMSIKDGFAVTDGGMLVRIYKEKSGAWRAII